MPPQDSAVDDPLIGRTLEEKILIDTPAAVGDYVARLARLEPGTPLRRRVILRLIQRGLEALARKDFGSLDVLLLSYEPEVELVIHSAAGTREYRGHEGYRDYWAELHATWADLHWMMRRMLDGGDRWAAEMDVRAKNQASGEQDLFTFGTTYHFSSQGKLARQDVFLHQDGWRLALEAAGLSE